MSALHGLSSMCGRMACRASCVGARMSPLVCRHRRDPDKQVNPGRAQRPGPLGLARPPQPAAEVAARAQARVVAWAAERRDGDVDALLLEAAEQVGALGAQTGRRRLTGRKHSWRLHDGFLISRAGPELGLGTGSSVAACEARAACTPLGSSSVCQSLHSFRHFLSFLYCFAAMCSSGHSVQALSSVRERVRAHQQRCQRPPPFCPNRPQRC